ncbi:unnamed protein product [Aureobasidium uvarum]|uniref:DUF7730 domain-containing protein n=1 Tax=Aureobasidium uvarum TaxID=2773716 RepID=A0A9N8KR48_9PEZI|nr:unnamed protein product [Aureobasidium uvarum]
MPPSTRRLQRGTHLTENQPDTTNTTLAKPFPFLELPDTVRQRLYELHLEAPRGFVRLFSKSGPTRVQSKVTPAKVKINIMFTCRQIYQEAMPVLYRVNNFCIGPLPHADLLQDHDIAQCDKWIRNMPVKGRNLINKLELWLPIPPLVLLDFDLRWRDMREIFPGLKSLTLFFDLNNQLKSSWWSLPEPEECERYYQHFKSMMPQARETFVDLRMLRPSLVEWQPLIDSINEVWDVSPGESAFITQDLHHANKHAEQKRALEKALFESFGVRAAGHRGLSYWQIRQNKAINSDSPLTDDDTDDEYECFDKFDAPKIVARLEKKLESLAHGSFDFEEEEGSWW